MPFTRRATLALPALLAAPALHAQPTTWAPSRPLRLIVTYPPGGVTDIVGRLVADPLGRELGQAVVVENRAGAGGNIGTQAAVQAEPDGYTLMLGTTALFGVNPILYTASGIDALRDLVPVGITGEAANVLSVLPRRVRATTVAELVAEAKARPLVYGSVGNGSSSHLSALRFLQDFGIEATHVPYRGSAPLVAAMLANDVDFGFDTPATSTAHIRAGTFRALAVTTAQRASALPDVPTLKESGLPDYDMGIWFGIFAPRRIPAPVATRLKQAMAAIRTPAQDERLRNAFVDPILVPEDRMQAYVESTAMAWQAIARAARISAD
ncbi:Bug family tripartite tricarboxylate transporter substrate binding protein [Humitalea sp. 24SJ18S-53]|uniref:Bug family tripartite tricarboxylate transporter substrate binding protein n=1 Tax=Humitalea sp. 24SJ18S-53 TaxID=3422307 RepID=UPI003D67F227